MLYVNVKITENFISITSLNETYVNDEQNGLFCFVFSLFFNKDIFYRQFSLAASPQKQKKKKI